MQQSDGSYPTQPVLAIGAVVFHQDRVLLVKRSKPPAKGCWAIPGGSVHLGETLQEAAQREILEETGIVIRAKEPILTFDVIDKDENGRIRYHYLIVDLAAEYVSGAIQPGDDAADARWIGDDELNDFEVNPRTRKLLAGRFRFGG
jgi:ADP-ribose pyrophosphatase